MIRASVLRKVIRPHPRRAVAAAHHRLARAHLRRVLLGVLGLVERRAQQRPGPLLVLRLALVLGHLEREPRRLVADEPPGLDLVDVLPARPAAAAAEFFNVL